LLKSEKKNEIRKIKIHVWISIVGIGPYDSDFALCEVLGEAE